MDLNRYVELLRRRRATVSVFALAGLLVAAALTLLAPPEKTASTRLYFNVAEPVSVSDLNQGSEYTAGQMTSYAEIATSPIVLDGVAEDLGPRMTAEDLAGAVNASVPEGTAIVEITATADDAATAANIANSVARHLSTTVAELGTDGTDTADAVGAVRTTVIAEAKAPQTPAAPPLIRNLALGLLIGLVLGIGVAVLREVLETRIRNDEDVSTVTDLPVLGSLEHDRTTAARPVFVQDERSSPITESVRRLRTNLQLVYRADPPRSILITSAVAGEGKTTTAVNLAVSLAETAERVLLVDADLREPTVAQLMGLRENEGLAGVLEGRADLDDVIQRWPGTTLDVMPGGLTDRPTELLASPAMAALMDEVAGTYDVVVLDSAPLLPVADGVLLSEVAAGTLLLARAGVVRRRQLRKALGALRTVDARVLGTVLTGVRRRDLGGDSPRTGGTARDTGGARRHRVAGDDSHADLLGGSQG
jgi:polysaccharide biosynthesis transport protein